MGTRNNPGKFDCLSKAEPDEPMFVLLGRDPVAPMLVNMWVEVRSRMGEEQEKCEEALACADQMTLWLEKLGKRDDFVRALEICTDVALSREKDQQRIEKLEDLVRELCRALGSSDDEQQLRDEAQRLLEATP